MEKLLWSWHDSFHKLVGPIDRMFYIPIHFIYDGPPSVIALWLQFFEAIGKFSHSIIAVSIELQIWKIQASHILLNILNYNLRHEFVKQNLHCTFLGIASFALLTITSLKGLIHNLTIEFLCSLHHKIQLLYLSFSHRPFQNEIDALGMS